MNISIKRWIGGGAFAALCSLLWALPLALLLAGCIPGVTPVTDLEAADEGRPLVLSGREDAEIELPDGESLSWDRNDSLNLVVDGEWKAFRWFVDGDLVEETGKSLIRRVNDLPAPVLGDHTVTVKVTDTEGIVWTKRINFTVD